MKKYFPKIIVIFLLASIFQMTSSLCFQNLNSFKMIKAAEAATVNNISSDSPIDMSVSNITDCSDVTLDEVQMNNPVVAVGVINIEQENSASHSNNNSLLPCCQEGGHPNIISGSQSFGVEKFIPILISFNTNNLTISTPQITIYNTPILLPPELLSIKKTTLRI